MKEVTALTFLILGFIFDHSIIGPVFSLRRVMSIAICDIVLYLQSEGLNILLIYDGTTPFQYLKTVIANTLFYCVTRW